MLVASLTWSLFGSFVKTLGNTLWFEFHCRYQMHFLIWPTWNPLWTRNPQNHLYVTLLTSFISSTTSPPSCCSIFNICRCPVLMVCNISFTRMTGSSFHCITLSTRIVKNIRLPSGWRNERLKTTTLLTVLAFETVSELDPPPQMWASCFADVYYQYASQVDIWIYIPMTKTKKRSIILKR